MLDLDHDGQVTRSELRQLQLTAEEFAAREALDPPESLEALLTSIYLGFDRSTLASQAALKDAASSELARISSALKVRPSWLTIRARALDSRQLVLSSFSPPCCRWRT
jgi:hypothetical protein